jgi:hypothetical protein
MAQRGKSNLFIVIGDLFFDYGKDMRVLRASFGSVQEKPVSGMGLKYKILVSSQPREEKQKTHAILPQHKRRLGSENVQGL